MENNLYDIQPIECRLPLQRILLQGDIIDVHLRVLQYDPSPVYDRIKHLIQPYSRYQRNVSIKDMFPNEVKGICACGCDKELTGKRTRWATEDCSNFPVEVYFIIVGRADFVRSYLDRYYGYKCSNPHCNSGKIDLDADHIIGVKHGGGGCWLGNYQYLCKPCHRSKTNEDFGWNKNGSLPRGDF